MKIAVFLGSESDFDVVRDGLKILETFNMPYALEVTSAHRSPDRTIGLVRTLESQGVRVFISVAGKAAHLGGVVAAHTIRPVIGVPVGSATLNGLDALLSTVQMPKGVPVACMGIGKSGFSNAVLLALQILALEDPDLSEALLADRKSMAEKVEESSRRLKESL